MFFPFWFYTRGKPCFPYFGATSGVVYLTEFFLVKRRSEAVGPKIPDEQRGSVFPSEITWIFAFFLNNLKHWFYIEKNCIDYTFTPSVYTRHEVRPLENGDRRTGYWIAECGSNRSTCFRVSDNRLLTFIMYRSIRPVLDGAACLRLLTGMHVVFMCV